MDSNLDWGQDLPGLEGTWTRNGIPSIKLSYFGTAEPRYYGIRCERLPGYPPPAELAKASTPGDLVAVSATNLPARLPDRRPRRRAPDAAPARQQPIASIGYSILIYRAEFSWRRP